MAPTPLFVAPAPPLPGPAHTTEAELIVQALESDVRLGLSDAKALELKGIYGLNQIKPPEKPSVSLRLLLLPYLELPGREEEQESFLWGES